MAKLTHIQSVVLTAAAKRDGGTVLPLPDALILNKGAARSMLKRLIKKGLVEEQPATAEAEVWREGDDGRRIMLAITDEGLEAIGVDPISKTEGKGATTRSRPKKPRKAAIKSSANSDLRPATKQALLIDLLKRKTGATIDEAVEATGWQAHSVRGAISGTLKKKLGLNVASAKVEGRGRVYRIAKQR